MSDMQTKIYGASDDLIEVEGQITEEFPAYSTENQGWVLAFSDGTLIQAEYDIDGIWRRKQLAKGSCACEKREGSAQQDTNDVITLTGDLKWCVLSERGQYSPAFARKP